MAQRRTIHEVTLQELTASNAEVQELVGERVPRAFREPSWLFWATAMLARTAAILDSVTGLAERGRRADAEVALRTLYTHVTTFCWLATDPDPHLVEWQGGSACRLRARRGPHQDQGIAGRGLTLPHLHSSRSASRSSRPARFLTASHLRTALLRLAAAQHTFEPVILAVHTVAGGDSPIREGESVD